MEAESITMSTPRSSFAQIDGSPPTRAKAGTVVTSSRASKRRFVMYLLSLLVGQLHAYQLYF